jgi:hypothetical protein
MFRLGWMADVATQAPMEPPPSLPLPYARTPALAVPARPYLNLEMRRIVRA